MNFLFIMYKNIKKKIYDIYWNKKSRIKIRKHAFLLKIGIKHTLEEIIYEFLFYYFQAGGNKPGFGVITNL